MALDLIESIKEVFLLPERNVNEENIEYLGRLVINSIKNLEEVFYFKRLVIDLTENFKEDLLLPGRDFNVERIFLKAGYIFC